MKCKMKKLWSETLIWNDEIWINDEMIGNWWHEMKWQRGQKGEMADYLELKSPFKHKW